MNKKRTILYVCAALGLIAVVALLCTAGLTDIDATEVGVQVNKLQKDIDTEPVLMGWCLYNRVKTSVFVYRVSARSFPAVDSKGREEYHTLQCKTKDGQKISVDLTTIYSLAKNDVPSLHESVGPTFEVDVLAPQVRSVSRIAIGKYEAEEIYQGEIRDTIQDLAKDALQLSLSEYPAIQIQDVLIRNYEFDPLFQKKIEDKKLADQEIEVNKRLAEASDEMAKKLENDAKGLKLAAIQDAEGKAESVKLAADAEKYQLEAQAAGQLEIYKSEAEGKRLLQEALVGEGGANVVALKFAEKIGPSLQMFGIPTGQQSMSLMDLSGMFGNMFKGTAP